LSKIKYICGKMSFVFLNSEIGLLQAKLARMRKIVKISQKVKNHQHKKGNISTIFTRCDKVVPGLGATNLLLLLLLLLFLLLLLLLLPVSEFWSFYTFSILPFLPGAT
jgi:hypothetical protein